MESGQVRILLVDDDSGVREMLAFALRKAGFSVSLASRVAEAQDALAKGIPDLILLDWMMPSVSGIEYVRALRRDLLTRKIPVIFLTARNEEEDKLRGFDSGADDFVTKPFSTKELIARIYAVLRRSQILHDNEGTLRFGGLLLNTQTCDVLCAGKPIPLGPTEFRLLKFFMAHPRQVHSRSRILDHLWGVGQPIEDRTVDVYVGRLRKALEPFGLDPWIETRRGSGYLFSEKPDPASLGVE
jgi:two-component system phosphate regulon response regulator PhoB